MQLPPLITHLFGKRIDKNHDVVKAFTVEVLGVPPTVKTINKYKLHFDFNHVTPLVGENVVISEDN